MKTKRKVWIAVLTVLGVSLLVAGTFAATQYTAYNDVKTGKIAVVLNEEVFINEKILPGQKLERPVSVTNPAGSGDSYIRVKVEKSFDNNGEGQLNTDYIAPILNADTADKWTMKEDGYYYYGDCVPSNTELSLFSGIEFSKDMDNRYSGHTATVTITAEAVQAKNNTEDPWGLNTKTTEEGA